MIAPSFSVTILCVCYVDDFLSSSTSAAPVVILLIIALDGRLLFESLRVFLWSDEFVITLGLLMSPLLPSFNSFIFFI